MSYTDIKNYCEERSVTLVAVSKTKPALAIQAMYDKGHRVFGENKVQELVDKEAALPKDIQWHFIGHLQRNKVKYIVPFVDLIHSVDSLKLLKEVNKQAAKVDRVVPVLLQFHIAREATKFGLSMSEAEELLSSALDFSHVQFSGVMGMATFTEDEVQVRKEFASLKKYFDRLKSNYFKDKATFQTVSMGMSGDYELAIEEGANMVRIGSLLFGARNY